MVQILETRYNESLDSAGLQSPQLMLEIWSSDESGSFTVLITKPDGKSCVVASGQNWHSFDQPAKAGITG